MTDEPKKRNRGTRKNGSEKKLIRKRNQYKKQEKLCTKCFMSWPLDQMCWHGAFLICQGCHSEK